MQGLLFLTVALVREEKHIYPFLLVLGTFLLVTLLLVQCLRNIHCSYLVKMRFNGLATFTPAICLERPRTNGKFINKHRVQVFKPVISYISAWDLCDPRA